MGSNEFDFKGGVQSLPGAGTCKFLMFLLNGTKEIPLKQAVKLGFVEHQAADSIINWNPNRYTTNLSILKILVYEDGGFGKEKFSQQFWLVLGKKLEKQIVTIKPRIMPNFEFKAEATFLKKSEVLSLIDPESMSAKVLQAQRTPAVSVLKQIIQIERLGMPQAMKIAYHGGIRKLRIRKGE